MTTREQSEIEKHFNEMTQIARHFASRAAESFDSGRFTGRVEGFVLGGFLSVLLTKLFQEFFK